MDAVYSNRALFTDVDGHRGGVSSSSMPGLMTRMLELLDVSPGQTVLEIGTGTGYNAALLCAALGDDHVFSVDIDYVDTARKRLSSLGYAPTLRTKDGLEGLPQYGPFDRIMSTVAVHRVPWSWVEQLAQDGAILTDLKLAAQAGNLVRLVRSGDRAEGRFDNGYAAFMSMRHPDKPEPTTVPRAHDPLCEGLTRLTPKVWEQTVPWFIAALELPVRLTSLGFQMGGDGNPVAEMLAAEDGSSATADLTLGADGARRTVQMGPTRLWDAVERGYHVWEEADRPGWERLGLTVTTDRQWVWLDKPDNSLCWDIPVRDVPAAELPT